MSHRNADYIVGVGNRGMGQTIPLSTHDNSKARLGFQLRMVECYTVVSKSHGSRAETEVVETGSWRVEPSPGHEEYGTHRNADGTAVQWLARVASEQDSIDAECRCRTEDGTYISSIYHTLNNNDAPCILTDISNRVFWLATYGTEYATRQYIARELG